MQRLTILMRGGLALAMVVGCLSTSTGPQPDPPTDVWRDDDIPDADSLAAGCSCGGTEEPEPTGWRPQLVPTFVIATSGPDQVTIVGPPGAVDPGGLDVVGLDLGGTDPPVVVESREDGSFQLTIGGQLTDEYRLVAQGGGSVHSSPADVTGPAIPEPSCIAGLDATDTDRCSDVVDESTCWERSGCLWSLGTAAPVHRTSAIPECLQFGPRRWMSFGSRSIDGERSMSFEVLNECDESVAVTLSTRRGGESFTLEEGIEGEVVTVEPASSTSLGIIFSPDGVGEFEDVVFVDVLEPDIGRWAISLWGEGM